jgi:hypothetical protein
MLGINYRGNINYTYCSTLGYYIVLLGYYLLISMAVINRQKQSTIY